MKGLAALAMVATTAALTITGAAATERTARLTDPATGGEAVTRGTVIIPQMHGDAPMHRHPSESPLGLSELELERIRSAISGQIRAFGSADAEGAFALLAPVTKDYFTDAAGFWRLLTTKLAPMTRADSFEFTQVSREAADAIQNVVVTDRDGRNWIASFTVERQPDGSWGIKRCVVEPFSGRGV